MSDDEPVSPFSPEFQEELEQIADRGPTPGGKEELLDEFPELEARFATDLERRGLTPEEVRANTFRTLHPDHERDDDSGIE